MKNMKKLLAFVLVAVMALGLVVSANAVVNITVNRDDTYTEGGTEESGVRTYTYYQIFRAAETENHTSTGGGYDDDGTPGAVTTAPEKGISYYLNASDTEQIAALGTWNDSADPKWTKAEGNEWFKLTKSADGTRYTVEWDNTKTDTDTVQAAAKWLKEKYKELAKGDLIPSSDGKKWTAENLPEGYYLLAAETGNNLIAATADITVNEKNSYPTVDKKQSETESDYADDALSVKVGDTIYYQIEVKVPADANADITVSDIMSTGLTYDTATDPVLKVDDVALTADTDETKNDYVIGAKSAQSWELTIHPTDVTKGKTVVITFAAVVNNDALIDTGRDNEVDLDYGNYHQEDTVEFDIGAAAIIKYDGATADLDGTTNALTAKEGKDIKYLEATFTLTDNTGAAVNVTKVSDGVYKVDTTATSNVVTTNKAKDGVLLIYGLDPAVTYKLTETATENGYNLLAGPVDLTVVKAEKADANTIKVVVEGIDGVSAGDASADEDHTLTLTPKQVTKVENNQGSVLPSTGGIGTTIFYIIGGLLVIAAGVLLVTRRRMSTEK